MIRMNKCQYDPKFEISCKDEFPISLNINSFHQFPLSTSNSPKSSYIPPDYGVSHTKDAAKLCYQKTACIRPLTCTISEVGNFSHACRCCYMYYASYRTSILFDCPI